MAWARPHNGATQDRRSCVDEWLSWELMSDTAETSALCYSESGNGDAAIKSQALGGTYPGMKRSHTPELTVPYVVPGLCAKPLKYAWINSSLKCLRGYLWTICSRTSEGN